MGILTDMMQEENKDINVAADDAPEAPPITPAVRSIFHKSFAQPTDCERVYHLFFSL